MILVIGGSGFVGSRLLSEVNREKFINFDKQISPFFNDISILGDVRSKEDLNKVLKGIETVVLLAAEHRDDVSPKTLYYDVNVKGTLNVLNAMDENNVKKLIFTSSVAVYGLNKDNPNENHPIDPFNDYGKSKWEAEKAIKNWYEKSPEGKSVTIIRPTVIFGERNRGNVYNLLKQISSGKFLMVGKGENRKSMAYVGNVVSFVNQCIFSINLGYNVFNYIDKPDFSMNELVKQVEVSLQKNVPSVKIPLIFGLIVGYTFDALSFVTKKKFFLSSIRVKKFCATTQFDSRKSQENFKAPYSLSKGLDRTLKFEFIENTNNDVVFYSE